MVRVRGVLAIALAAVLSAACLGTGGGSTTDEGAAEDVGQAEGPVRLTISENAVRGGKNATTAEWLLEYAIPTFEDLMAEQDRDVTVRFVESGVDDEDFKSRLALDLSSEEGADVIGFDSFWTSEFAAAGYLQPLDQVVGEQVDDWEGWEQIPDAVAGSLVVDDRRFGIPVGTDGRVIFYRKDVFADAGLPQDWQPTSWDEILDTGRQIAERSPDVTPIQLNAGVPMGEATTLQGFMPILLGTGAQLYDDGWLGDTPQLREALEFFATVYGEQLGDSQLQVRADGRDRSFSEFAEGRIGMLIESDYLWRSVIAPEVGLFPVPNRDEVVGYAQVPAREPGAGIRGQDFVSASGGTGRVLNPNTEFPLEAWEFMTFLASEEALTEFVQREPRITARADVNETPAVADDPILEFIATETLPLTWFRPGFEEYTAVSEAIQRMVESVATGTPVPEAAGAYQAELEEAAGADNVVSEG